MGSWFKNLTLVTLTLCTPLRSSPDNAFIKHHIAEIRDRILVAEDRLHADKHELDEAKFILARLTSVGDAIAMRAQKRAKFEVANLQKSVEEAEIALLVEKEEERLWANRLAHSASQADLLKQSTKIWTLRASLYAKMEETAQTRLEYEQEHHTALQDLAKSGAISGREIFEAGHRVHRAQQQLDLARARKGNAEKPHP